MRGAFRGATVSGHAVRRCDTVIPPLEEAVDHFLGYAGGHVIVEYGDYECPFARRAFREIERVLRLGTRLTFVFRHFPLTEKHPHALVASAAAEAAALQGRFWEMHVVLFHGQDALADEDLRRYAAEVGLDIEAFDEDRAGGAVIERIRRDVESGLASGEVDGTPTLFIDGVVHRGPYDARSLVEAISASQVV
jgi:formate-nitrite transporter family protein